MKQRPIIFSAPMVRAILDGRKTQTRRILKSSPHSQAERAQHFEGTRWDWLRYDGLRLATFNCPYSQPGDLLWVRETWARYNIDQDSHDMAYRATPPADWPSDGNWRPSIFMPRWASRITLEVTAVRIERLQDISEKDSWAEGCDGWDDDVTGGCSGYGEFAQLWSEIHGPGSWDANPWVWVIEFKRVTES